MRRAWVFHVRFAFNEASSGLASGESQDRTFDTPFRRFLEWQCGAKGRGCHA